MCTNDSTTIQQEAQNLFKYLLCINNTNTLDFQTTHHHSVKYYDIIASIVNPIKIDEVTHT